MGPWHLPLSLISHYCPAHGIPIIGLEFMLSSNLYLKNIDSYFFRKGVSVEKLYLMNVSEKFMFTWCTQCTQFVVCIFIFWKAVWASSLSFYLNRYFDDRNGTVFQISKGLPFLLQYFYQVYKLWLLSELLKILIYFREKSTSFPPWNFWNSQDLHTGCW